MNEDLTVSSDSNAGVNAARSVDELRQLIVPLVQQLEGSEDTAEEIIAKLRSELVTAKELLNPETNIPRVVKPAKIPSMLVELLIQKQKAAVTSNSAAVTDPQAKKKRRTSTVLSSSAVSSVMIPETGESSTSQGVEITTTTDSKFNEEHGKRRLTEFLSNNNLAPQSAIFSAERIICVPCSWLFKHPSEHAAPKGKTWNYKVHCFGQKGAQTQTKHTEAYNKWTEQSMPSVVYQVVPISSMASSSSSSSSSSTLPITTIMNCPNSPKQKRRKRTTSLSTLPQPQLMTLGDSSSTSSTTSVSSIPIPNPNLEN